ncbi:peptide-methionine (S)-S-oxide reductase [Aquimarina mytili]|uniref:peptide-methionine (S)-S-oxide reductase n=1 Tax=Aquimarina mytili TaxID=874423 RepID=A0A936ZSF9_9FLAO|nr:peptide-methionine (S)-S-oxide reductase [Aquimarina mytili]MBL0684779.1 peptide-methionine (S)-S-oxide reductase [Aquimarina mytili]
MELKKIGFGGGCHWCTEAVFQALKGVTKVAQGYIKSTGNEHYFSEAVIVSYDPMVILLKDLIEIHLHTHKSTANHSFRKKYRSAIYYFEEADKNDIEHHLDQQQQNFNAPIITKTLPFLEFSPSRQELLDYYIKNPEKPFCKKYIHPKLEFLRNKYATSMK